MVAASVSAPQVLAEIQAGHGLGVGAAGRKFPGQRGNKSTDPVTIWRWITQGAKGPDGVTRIKLEAVRVGGRWLTSEQAIGRFVAALTGTANQPTPAPRAPAERRRASAAAARRLEKIGA